MELECIDRMYLNAYVPQLTSEAGIAAFCRGYLGHRFASTKQAVEMTKRFVRSIEALIQREGLESVRFPKGQRKDQVLQAKRRRFSSDEGVIFVGVAQEKVRVPRTTRKRLESGGTIPWIIYSTARVNVYYFYCRDRDFGPFFLKFGSYFPYSAKLCLNGHEYLKRQLTQRDIAFEALDNGLLSCGDLPAAQRISNGLSAAKIETFFRKWLARLPHPYSSQDRRAGYRYDLSILQAEFSLTQMPEQALGQHATVHQLHRPASAAAPAGSPRPHRLAQPETGPPAVTRPPRDRAIRSGGATTPPAAIGSGLHGIRRASAQQSASTKPGHSARARICGRRSSNVRNMTIAKQPSIGISSSR
jgi:hypothetical protein